MFKGFVVFGVLGRGFFFFFFFFKYFLFFWFCLKVCVFLGSSYLLGVWFLVFAAFGFLAVKLDFVGEIGCFWGFGSLKGPAP